MAEDDVERLVAVMAHLGGPAERLARIVRELLAEHQAGECHEYDCGCSKAWPAIPSTWCTPCRNKALRERLCRLARGEK